MSVAPGKALPAAAFLLLAACSGVGPPPMEPLDESRLAAAERRWAARGSDSYHLVLRVRAPRVDPALYDLLVASGQVAAVERDGMAVAHAQTTDYSVPGLFDLLRQDLRLTGSNRTGDVPPIDLRARFESQTGRLERYRRTVGTERRRVLLIEVLEYEPLPGLASTQLETTAR